MLSFAIIRINYNCNIYCRINICSKFKEQYVFKNQSTKDIYKL